MKYDQCMISNDLIVKKWDHAHKVCSEETYIPLDCQFTSQDISFFYISALRNLKENLYLQISSLHIQCLIKCYQ